MGSQPGYAWCDPAELHENVFVSRKWYELAPDQNHTVVTAGYDYFSCIVGEFVAYSSKDADSLMSSALRRIRKLSGIGSITRNSCATASRTSDGSLVIVYMPTIRATTVDMSKLAGTTTARWYDPTSGEYADVQGSPFANEGSRQFIPSFRSQQIWRRRLGLGPRSVTPALKGNHRAFLLWLPTTCGFLSRHHWPRTATSPMGHSRPIQPVMPAI